MKLNKKGFTLTGEERKGFTLIELLIVIAILGTLAVVVLIALNPVQQLARTRDAGRISTVTQLGHAMQALGTTRGGAYPTNSTDTANCSGAADTGNTWVTNCLVNGGELPNLPANPGYSATTFASGGGCQGTASNDGNWCYIGNATGGTVYTVPESNANRSLCAATTQRAFIAYNTISGRGGILCVGIAAWPTAAENGGGTWAQ